MVEEENPRVRNRTADHAAQLSDSRKKGSSHGVLFKFHKLLFTKWHKKKKNEEFKSEHKHETNLEATEIRHPHDEGTIEDVQEDAETMHRFQSFRCSVDGIRGERAPTSPVKHRRSVDNVFPFLHSRRFSRSSSRRIPSPFSRSYSRRSPSPTSSSLYRSISRNNADLHPTTGLSRNTSRRSTAPIMYSNSTGMPVKPPAVEKKLECTLEELCFGCTKKIKITRDAITSSGQLIQDEETLSIKVKPGWKDGTKITFEGKGIEGTQQGDVTFTVAERRHQLFRRDGDDLELAVEIPLVKALTGCAISVPLLGGETMELSIDDEIIHPGCQKLIEGQGMPMKGHHHDEGARGNLKVVFLVEFPAELTDEQRSDALAILEDSC